MYIRLTSTDLELLHREADLTALRLVRQFGLPRHQRSDLRQDLLADLIARLKAFDPSRGTLRAFAGTVIAHQALRIANRIRREWALFAPLSLEDPTRDEDGATLGDIFAEADGYLAFYGQPTDRIAEVERRLNLERAVGTLPATAIVFCTALARGSATAVSQASQTARSSHYRRIASLRLDLTAAGLAAA